MKHSQRHSLRLWDLLRLGLCVLIGSASLWAAINQGDIRGTVTDPQGGVMPQVLVTITDTDTGVQATARTNGAGFYLFSKLVPGNYNVHFEAKGFIESAVNQVLVKPDEVSTVDMVLKLGATAQHIEVTATNPLVETSASNVGTAVNDMYVDDLPILGRDTQSLVNLVPGVTSSIGPPGTLVGFGGGQFSGMPDLTHIMGSFVVANGAQPGGSEWYLDGNLNSMEGQDNMAVDPPPDAIAEFQTINTAYAAEYGRKEGALFSQVLKSGSNNVHGDLYEYNRNNFLSARNPMTAPQPNGSVTGPNYANWNQFGGTIGAPIVIPHVYNGKNRSFIFAAWDVSLLHESGPWLGSIPTALEHTGNFSEFPTVVQYGLYDPLSAKLDTTNGVYYRTPFTDSKGNLTPILPASRLDPVGSWVVNQFPTPNFLDPRQQNAAAGGCLNTCNNYESTYGNSEVEQSIVIKVDHEVSEKDKLFVDYLWNPGSYRFLRYPWDTATAPLVGFNGTYPYNVSNVLGTLGESHTFTPTLVNEFRFTYGRQFEQALPEDPVKTDEADMLSHLSGLNIPLFPPFQPVPSWYIGNATAGSATGAYFGSPINNMVITGNNYTVLDNITKVWSKHTIKAGFMYRSDITGSVFPTESNLNFSHGLTENNTANNQGGNAYAQVLLGAVDQSTNQRYVDSTIGSDHYAGIFAQDDYRITSKLTINYGLRWDVFTWFNDRHNNYGLVDLKVPDPIDPMRTGAIVYPNTPQHPSRRPFPANHDDFGPRFNFSYTPFNDGKTVVRGGWDMIYVNDISYDLGPAVGANEAVGYTPSPSYVFFDATGHNYFNTEAVPAYILGKGAPSLQLDFTNPRITDNQWNGPGSAGYGGGFFSFVPFTHDPYTMIFNLQVQRQLAADWMISVGYVGAQGRHITFQGNDPYSDQVSTATKLQYKSALNDVIATPADLVKVGWPATETFGATQHAYQQWEQFATLSWPTEKTDYNSLLVKVEKRFSHGFDFLAAYTFQKTIASAQVGAFCSNNWVGVDGWANGRGRMSTLTFAGAQDFFNQREDRALANDDTPNILNTAFSYTLPFGPGREFLGKASGVARQIVQGWKFSGNFNTQSGIPMSVGGPGNSLTGRPNLIGDPNSGRSGESRYAEEQQYFNPNAFEAVFGSSTQAIQLATSGTPAQKDAYTEGGSYPFWRFGTAGQRLGNMRTPPFWNVDSSIGKDFIVTESKRFEFRANAFNLFNHQNLGTPNNGWCQGPNSDGSTDAVHVFGCQFGRITSVQTDPRAWQFSLKFVF